MSADRKQFNKRMLIAFIVCIILNAALIVILLMSSKRGFVFKHKSKPDIIKNAVSDIDGNVYDAVHIGNQVWMKENLRTTHYADGTSIPQGNSTSEIQRYYPDDNSENVEKYGYLYNWSAVMHGESSSNANPSGVQGICPDGWHVPSKSEWEELENYLSSQCAYRYGLDKKKIAKALASENDWASNDYPSTVGNHPSLNNSTGFSAVPAGTSNDSYDDFGHSAYFWSATQRSSSSSYAYNRRLSYVDAIVTSDGSYNFNLYEGYSVRCLRD